MTADWFPELDGRVQESFRAKLNALRERCGFPLPVTSAYRTPDENAALSTTGRDGPHTTGRAVDIAVSGERAFILLKYALEAGFTGIGLRQHGPLAKRFVHLDDLGGPEFPRPRPWTYP